MVENDSMVLPRHHRNLEHKNRNGCNADGKQRLRDPDGQGLVCHVRSPWIEFLERFQIAPPANAQQTGYLHMRLAFLNSRRGQGSPKERYRMLRRGTLGHPRLPRSS
jgi:hypothetical protein